LVINGARTLGLDADEMRGLSFADQLTAYLAAAQARDVLPRDWTREWFERWVRLTSINSLASMRYRPRPYSGRLVLINTHVIRARPMRAPRRLTPCGGWPALRAGLSRFTSSADRMPI